jgi:predicted membrane metal-binding protein
MTFANPYTLWDPGFVLSATATLGLVLYADPLERAARALLARWLSEPAVDRIVGLVGDALIVTTAAQITTTPYIVYTFRRLSLITLLVNFLVLPAQPPVMLWRGAGPLAGRRGVGDATSAACLAAVRPSAVVISVAPDPRMLLPDGVLLQRLAGVPVWRTDEHGAGEFVGDGAGLWVVTER